MAVNFNGTSLVASNLDHNINFNGCTVCTVVDNNGYIVFDRQDATNLNMLYGQNQLSGPDGFRKPNRYVCLPTYVAMCCQVFATSGAWSNWWLCAAMHFWMCANIRLDSGTWRHIYANGGCPRTYQVMGNAYAYLCTDWCVESTNLGTSWKYYYQLPPTCQTWTNLWTCVKSFEATPTIWLCNPAMCAWVIGPTLTSGLVGGVYAGGVNYAVPRDVWVAYEPLILRVNYGNATRDYNIANNGCCAGATAWINMCYS